MIPINNHSLIIESKIQLHRQCEAYDDYQSKCFIFIYSDDKNYVEKWKNKKFIRWKTTNILIVHLQNWMIPIIYNQSIYQSKNRLHRQCEAYDDYQLKYPIYHSLLSFFSVENFLLRKKRQIKRQIIKKRQIKKNQKISWKTTNISIVHLQNRSIPIKYNLSLLKSKNRLHRQCEAYDDY